MKWPLFIVSTLFRHRQSVDSILDSWWWISLNCFFEFGMCMISTRIKTHLHLFQHRVEYHKIIIDRLSFLHLFTPKTTYIFNYVSRLKILRAQVVIRAILLPAKKIRPAIRITSWRQTPIAITMGMSGVTRGGRRMSGGMKRWVGTLFFYEG